MSVNAAFGHRTGLRFGGNVRYVCWAVPEAVYVDYDVIQNAPPVVNRSGICEILCYHTAHADWRYARDRGQVEDKWPYDQSMIDEAGAVMATVMEALDDIRQVNESGIRALMTANRWGGAAFHNFGWNPRPIEGADHFLFYALEYYTGKKFIHGQPSAWASMSARCCTMTKRRTCSTPSCAPAWISVPKPWASAGTMSRLRC